MEFDFETLPPDQRYKLMIQVVVPRPIAFVTCRSRDGQVNAAPYSFFNCMSQTPPLVVLGIENRTTGVPKDTTQYIRETDEFVVNMVDFAMAERMNVCAADFPPGVNELTAAGLTEAPSVKVAAPRIAESPVSMECRKYMNLEIGRGRSILFGEIVHLHVRDTAIADLERLRVDPGALDLIARLGGIGYARTTDRFDLKRVTYAEWLDEGEGASAPSRLSSAR